MKRVINIENAPKAIGPYSQGIAFSNLVFFSGQLGVDPTNGKMVEGGVEEQTRQIFKNIAKLLESEGLSAKNVIKTTVFISDMNSFATMNAEYAKFFNENPPARSCVEVSKLPLNALVEVEVIAGK